MRWFGAFPASLAGATAIAELEKIDRAQSQPLPGDASQSAESSFKASTWRVTEQQQLNSADGRELFMVTLDAEQALPAWQAGDILDIQPHNANTAIAEWLNKHELNPDTVIAVEGTPTPLKLVLQTRGTPACVHNGRLQERRFYSHGLPPCLRDSLA